MTNKGSYTPPTSEEDHIPADKKVSGNFILLLTGILLLFSLAVFTGTLFRWSFIGNIPEMLEQGNIRHAHSHLMFFGWVTLLPFLLLVYDIHYSSQASASTKVIYTLLGWLFWLSLATWPAFLLYGYEPMHIGASSLPVSVMLSGIIMLLWYGFVIYYWYCASSAKSPLRNVYTDAAIILLLASSLGAWGVAAIQFLAPHSPLLAKASTHFFLTVFAEGWCMLFGLSIINALISGHEERHYKYTKTEYAGASLIALGSLFLFPYAMGQDFMTPAWIWIVRLATLASLGGYVMLLATWRSSLLTLDLMERLPLLFLLFKIIMLLAALFIPAELWLGRHQVNIFYLHNSLLGFVTLVMVAYLRRKLRKIIPEVWPYILFYITVLLVWLSLIPMMPGFPFWALGTWIYTVAAYVSLWPGVISILLALLITIRYGSLIPNTK